MAKWEQRLWFTATIVTLLVVGGNLHEHIRERAEMVATLCQ